MGANWSSTDYMATREYAERRRKTVQGFDPLRYSGSWWEVARYPLFWETDCERATAEYQYNPLSKQISVTNRCWTNDRLVRDRKAVAWAPDENEASKLKLRFIDGGPSDNFDAPYWVHWTDYENYSIVGGPSGQYLWILSRKEKIPATDIPKLMRVVSKFGYDPSKLMASPKAVQN